MQSLLIITALIIDRECVIGVKKLARHNTPSDNIFIVKTVLLETRH